MGKGVDIDFWNNKGCKIRLFKCSFLSIFETFRPRSKVIDPGCWVRDRWFWNTDLLSPSENLMAANSECKELEAIFIGISQNHDLAYKFIWWRDPVGFFIRSTYTTLLKGRLGFSSLNAFEEITFRLI